jgi:hypothetical protein
MGWVEQAELILVPLKVHIADAALCVRVLDSVVLDLAFENWLDAQGDRNIAQ